MIAFNWGWVQRVWATPTTVDEVYKTQTKQASSLEQIAQMTLENKNRQDKQEAISELHITALKEQLSLVAELKKKR